MRQLPVLSPTARQFVRRSIAVVGILVCCCGMGSGARAGLARLLADYGAATNQLGSVDEAVRWSATDPEAHHAHALVLTDMGQAAAALPEFERAVALRPDDYYLWLEVGHAREETADAAGARAAFKVAMQLAPGYAQPQWQYGNFLLRTGEVDAAFGALRQASASDALLFPAMIDLAWGAYDGQAQAVLSATQPRTDAARMTLANFFAAHREYGAALNLFRLVGSKARPEEQRALVAALLAAGEFSAAHEVWAGGSINSNGNGSSLYDGGFEREINVAEAGFGWRPFRGALTVHFGLDASEPHTGLRSLRLEYGGGFAPTTPVISQLALVKAHTRYRLSFAARTEDLVTAGLPLVLVQDAAGAGQMLAQANTLPRGTSAWQVYTTVFVTADTTQAVLLCIQRQNCNTAPCPIFGRAWFDDFLLEEL